LLIPETWLLILRPKVWFPLPLPLLIWGMDIVHLPFKKNINVWYIVFVLYCKKENIFSGTFTTNNSKHFFLL